MNKYQAQQSFWSSFEWAAFNENTVPGDALAANDNRIITYESFADSLGNSRQTSASLWHRSTSWTVIHAKAEEIAEAIESNVLPAIPIDGGYLKIRKGTPFATDMSDEDDTIRRVILNVEIEYLTRY